MASGSLALYSFTKTQVEHGNNAARILAMHHYLLFLTNVTVANGLCLSSLIC